MYYLFHGSDTDKTRKKAHAFLDALFKKRPSAQLFRIDADTFDEEELKRLIEEQGLFEAKHIVLLDHILENKEAGEALHALASDFVESPNMFVLLEGPLLKKDETKLSKKAKDVYVYNKEKAKQKKDAFNLFAITDMFGARDKRKTWKLFHEALAGGVSPEEVHGILHWQVKSMLLARGASSATQANLKPFVYKKSCDYAEKFTQQELVSISKQLVTIYHESRKGEGNLAENLELFILRVL